MAKILANNKFSSLSPSQRTAFADSVLSGEYNLFLGAGICLDAKNNQNELLPSGDTFKSELCSLLGIRTSSSLQRVFGSLSPQQVAEHVTKRFLECRPGPSVEKLPTFLWRRIFTLNVDDVLEKIYLRPGNLQTAHAIHFKDPFVEFRTLEDLPIVHLHGQASKPDLGYVFARSEYARMMSQANAWMTVLADIMPVNPFIISGTTLDEIDLEFYLARRSSSTVRKDRGPSFFVEPYPDAQTEKECEKYDLILYQGTFYDFLNELDDMVPDRLAPAERVPSDTKALFPPGTSKGAILSFANDFDLVPAQTSVDSKALKFSYGNPPAWSDLAGNWDVGRSLTARVRPIVEAMISRDLPERGIVILDTVGVGKTTVARRVAFDMAAKGFKVLECSALSRIDQRTTAASLDLIDGPVILLVDNFAEQAASIAGVLASAEKADVVFLGAERSYREHHITRAFGDIRYRTINGLTMSREEAEQLVANYTRRGMTGAPEALRNPSRFAAAVQNEPIAVACCHILNDMRPLDTLIQTIYLAASSYERHRYLTAAVAQFCFGGGVRHEILAAVSGTEMWDRQFQPGHPLPLEYISKGRNSFIVPLNGTLAERALARAPLDDVSAAFEGLARGIAAWVNRDAIIRRSPEARLAGRLFDYEDVLKRFLYDQAGSFYINVQKLWQWNSRYWEQVALYHLAMFWSKNDYLLLQQAIQHARHAVSIEAHPFGFTTLGKVLLAQIGLAGITNSTVYAEAFEALTKAIEIEDRRGRASVPSYITPFRGTVNFLESGGRLTSDQNAKLRQLATGAGKDFPRDRELREVTQQLASKF
jgi:hypothetical protein